MSSKRTRTFSQTSFEPIILKLIELSAELRKGKIAKDGLHQYKRMVQATNISSIEVVVEKFLHVAEEKLASAQAKADKITLDADDDLEAGDSPEDILLSTVSSEQSKDRTDREFVTPWLRFLWEAYRSILEVLRNNSKLETLYKNVVERCFDFCLKYSRKTEFRRLCDLLRSHLQAAAYQAKLPPQTQQLNPIDLGDPETLQRYLDTRFDQLNVAVKLELWQEAFRSVEDIHTLLTVSKRPAKLSSMANYYENLARIFLVSGNLLFHAAAWSRYYSLVLQARSVPENELTRIATSYMLSVLAIPPTGPINNGAIINGSNSVSDEQKNRYTRLSSLLNLTKIPTRESLLSSALNKNVLAHVRPEIKDLYRILEVDFHPLSIKKRISPVIEKIGADSNYSAYIRSLYQVILARLFQQLSQVYKTVKLDFVVKLASLPAPFNATPAEIEKFIVRGCQNGKFAIKIDHVASSITFRDDIYEKIVSGNSESLSLQSTPSEIVQCQLSNLAKTLSKTISTVDPIYLQQIQAMRKLAVERAKGGLAQENAEILKRQGRIERRIKDAQTAQAQKEEKEAEARAAKVQADQLAEQQRLADEQKRREEERLIKEREAISKDEKRLLAEQINSKGIIHIDIDNLDEVDTEKMRKMEIEQLEKEKSGLNYQNRITGRRIDHLVRAYRLEEIPLWKKDAEDQDALDKKLYEARINVLKVKSKQQHEEALVLRDRLVRLVPEYKTFRAEVENKRRDIFEAKRQENEKLLAAEKEKRVQEVRARREREAKEAAEREKAEAIAREKAEEERKIQEAKDLERAEQERKAEEERASRPAAYVPGMLRRSNAQSSTPASSASAPTSLPRTQAPPPTTASRSDPFGGARPRTEPSRAPAPEATPSAAPKKSAYVPPSRRRG